MLMVLKTYKDTMNTTVLFLLLFQAGFIVISFTPPLSKYKLNISSWYDGKNKLMVI